MGAPLAESKLQSGHPGHTPPALELGEFLLQSSNKNLSNNSITHNNNNNSTATSSQQSSSTGTWIEKSSSSSSCVGVSDHATVSQVCSILTAIKLAAKVVNRELSRANTFGLDVMPSLVASSVNSSAAAAAASSAAGLRMVVAGDGIALPATRPPLSPSAAISASCRGQMAELAHRRFVDALRNRQVVAGIASQLEEDIILSCKQQALVAMVHPLDGISQVDVNVSTGTLFSIYRRVTVVGTDVQERDFLQAGCRQLCAGYVIYGSSTMLVCTLGYGVQGFTMDPSLGTFYMSHRDIQIPPGKGEDGSDDGIGLNIYSINSGKYKRFPEGVKEYLKACQERGFPCRYIGSMVADFHRNMLKGGIYIYPPTFTDPKPSVSMVFQCFPLAFLAEQAGGKASDGFTRILDIEPTSLTDRICFFCGSANMVRMAERCMARNKMKDGGWFLKKDTEDVLWGEAREARAKSGTKGGAVAGRRRGTLPIESP
eukprot:GHVQ01029157.1.p1 GENE.GHVQ01029157.1~~GHVQ01029157.1.p1  ORF type:complete len:485 (+),score=89.56 GHVQ01029157.1:587-2041(+)